MCIQADSETVTARKVRVFRPVFKIRGEYRWLLLRTMFCSKEVRDKKVDEWLDGRSPIGEDPLDKVSVYRTRASEYRYFAL